MRFYYTFTFLEQKPYVADHTVHSWRISELEYNLNSSNDLIKFIEKMSKSHKDFFLINWKELYCELPDETIKEHE